MALVIRGNKIVLANSGGRVISNSGQTVIIASPSHRFVYEKQFVGERVTRVPKMLADWVKKKKVF